MVEFQNVTKKYGNTAAVEGVSIKTPKSGIYCLLGRNGAGKTTFMKLIAGHIAATDGRVAIGGKDVNPAKMPDGVIYIESGAPQFNMRVAELVNSAASLQDGFDKGFADNMIRRFNLDPKKRYTKLSFGMKSMVTAIITLASNADVVLLDEPTLGFDAIMRSQFNALLMESYGANPRLIIVSTHLIDEIAKVAERLIIIDSGKILLEAGMEDIDEKAYTLSGAADTLMPLLNGLNCIGKTKVGSVMAAHIYDARISPPEGISIDRLGLQDFFVNIVGGGEHE